MLCIMKETTLVFSNSAQRNLLVLGILHTVQMRTWSSMDRGLFVLLLLLLVSLQAAASPPPALTGREMS